MKILQEYLGQDRIKELGKHPRHKYIDEIVTRINKEREGTDYKPTTPRIIGIKTAHLSLDDLYYLVKTCSQKPNFSRMFFGLLKVK